MTQANRPTSSTPPDHAGLPKAYEPADVEERLYQWWEARGFFHAEPDDAGEPFSIVIPLPNITGSLHMGHALNHSIQDALIRWQRMRGANAMWQPGTDHAGIATQNVVEKELAKEGLSRDDVGRGAFLERVWAWKEQSGGLILSQMRRLGASPDWAREAFTLDEPRSRAVREVFCALFEDGLIYRGNRLINWCPRCATALSDIEVDHEDTVAELAYLRYPLADADGSEGVIVATTRAETMLGDTAVAVHPDDDRYAHLVGKTVVLPLLDREIPVIADEQVDPSFGTGAVKVTPAHDPNDYEIGERHGLDFVDVMTDAATINAAGGPYEGLDRFQARRKVKEDLAARGLLVKVAEHSSPVGHCSRCKTVIEPRLSDQWFVKVGPLAAEAARAVRDGRTRFIPERNAKGFLGWMDNLHDWCISRQLWWGHRIPVWYDGDGNAHALREDPTPAEVEAKGLVQDPDVLDTWFSSALWPFSTQGWERPGSDTPALRTWYPTSVLVTGYDINTFWVSRMLMMGLRFMREVPFHTVLNHGMVRDARGKKMSKSFGNVIDPLEFMDRYGADALRFALLRAAAPGNDPSLAEEWVEGARRFANKLWNAARFVLMTTAADPGGVPPEGDLALEDRWILSRLEATRARVDEALEGYDLSRASQALYHFVWDEYCDWYLELAKLRRARTAAEEPSRGGDRLDEAAGQVLRHVLDVVVRLLHPITPFVTEEVWRTLHQAGDNETIMRAAWPAPDPARRAPDAEAQFAALQDAVTGLRRFRADHGLAPSLRMTVLAVADSARLPVLKAALDGIRRLTGVERWVFTTDPAAEGNGPLGKVPVEGAVLFVPLQGLVDLDEERERLSRELRRAREEHGRAERKLGNAAFVDKAPDEVVQAERDKARDWEGVIDQLTEQLDALA